MTIEKKLRDLTLNEEKQKDLIHRLKKVADLFYQLEKRQKEVNNELHHMSNDLYREIQALKDRVEIDIDGNSKKENK